MANLQQVWAKLDAGGPGLASQFHGAGNGDGLIVTENMWIDTANCEASRARNLQIPRGRGIDTVFLLDISGSMAEESLSQMKAVVLEILKSIQGCLFAHQREENVAIVTFGHTTTVDCHLTNDYEEIRASVDRLWAGGRSPMLAGMYMALSAIAARGTETVINGMSVHPRIILVSDGHATNSEYIQGTDQTSTLPVEDSESILNLAIRLGADQHPISCVPVGNANEDFLLEIASKSGGHLVPQQDVHRIGRYFKNLTEVTSMKRKHDLTTKDPQVFANLARSMLKDVKDSDIEDMMLILLETDNLSSCKTKEDEILDPQLPLMGARVRRGKDWAWGEQDLRGPGTVTSHCNQIGWLTVQWDLNNVSGRYRYGAEDKYDLVVTQEPRILSEDELIGTGCLVCRDKDWSYGFQDGGPTNVGVVFDVNPNGIIRVRWPNGHMNSYKYGCEGMFDVKIWHPESNFANRPPTRSTSNLSSGYATSEPPGHYHQAPPPVNSDPIQTPSPSVNDPPVVHPPPTTRSSAPPSNIPLTDVLGSHQRDEEGTLDVSMTGVKGSLESGGDMFKSLETEVKDDELYSSNLEYSPPVDEEHHGRLNGDSDSDNSNLAGTLSPGTSPRTPVFTQKNIYWQYQPPGGTWQKYPDDVNQKIEEKYKKKDKTVLIKMEKDSKPRDYRIKFGSLKQTPIKRSGEPDSTVRRIEVPVEIWGMDKEKVDLYFSALEDGEETLKNIRLMVVGHEGVGKTTLCHHLMKKVVPEDLESTNGIDIYIHRYLIDMKSMKQTCLPDRQEEAACLRLAKVVANFKHSGNMMGENLVVPSKNQPDIESLCSLNISNISSGDHSSSSLSSETEVMKIGNKIFDNADEGLQDQRSFSSDEGYINKYRQSRPTIRNTWNNTGKPSREHTITNFFKNDMMDVMQKSEGEDKGEDKAYLSVWDFGGQKVFYDSHHIFLSKDAVYLVCFNVHDCLSDEVKKMAEFERAGFWLHSIGTLSTKAKDSSKTELPPIILVGTHMDKVEGKDEKEKHDTFMSMCDKLLKRPYLEKLKNHIQGYCAVDNSHPDLPWIDELWVDIVTSAPYQSQWNRALPAKWLALERELMKLKGQGQKIMTFKEVTELDKKLEAPIEKVEEIEVFLEYLHQTGNIMFFKDGIEGEDMMSRKLVLDPQWIVYAFRCLITDSKFTNFDSSNLETMWKMYHLNAELLQPLVDALWRGDPFREHKAILLALMENLGLISRPKSLNNIKADEKVQYYIVPTILRETGFDWMHDVLEESDTIAQSRTLCLMYEFLPFTIFHKLLAACIGHYKLAAHLTTDIMPLQKGFGCFMVGQHWHMILHCKNSMVKVTMFKFVETVEEKKIMAGELKEVREFLEGALKKILERHQLDHVTFQYGLDCKFWCGENEPGVIMGNIQHGDRMLCCRQPKPHYFRRDDFNPWFAPQECDQS